MVKKLALDELVSWKVQQGEAEKYGLIQDSSYALIKNAVENYISGSNSRKDTDSYP